MVKDIDGTVPGGAPDDRPNDNRDTTKTMYAGTPGSATLATYNTMQGGSLAPRSAVTEKKTINGVERYVAEVQLSITNRFAGDNYQVRATTINPGGKPFNDDSRLTDRSVDADIPRHCVAASAVLTAWKRIYYEKDVMYRVGGFLVKDVAVGDDRIEVSKEKK